MRRFLAGSGLLVFGTAFLGRLPALRSYWCLDDWGQLARAAGTIPAVEGWPARFLSQHWWWSLTYPFFGTDFAAHALLRMALHGLAALAVWRIGRRLGLEPGQALLAGLLFGASPVAFTVLYWASGIQELLGGLLVLWAVERWLHQGGKNVVASALLGALAMLAKENALGLPLLLLATYPAWGRGRRGRAAAAAFLLAVAIVEAYLVMGHFPTGEKEPYQLGGLITWIKNLGQMGLVLAWPLPLYPPPITMPYAAGGFLFWGAWFFRAWRQRARQQHLVGLALLGALLSLAPMLPLVTQSRPYMAYTAVGALALVLGSLLPRSWSWPQRPWPALALAAICLLYSAGGMLVRMQTHDPVVWVARESRQAVEIIRQGMRDHPVAAARGVTVFQQPLGGAETLRRADQLGPEGVQSMPVRNALEGKLGLSLLVPPGVPVRWTSNLTLPRPVEGLVFWERVAGIQVWGPAGQAFMRAGMIDMVVGQYSRAAAEFLAAEGRYDPQNTEMGPEFASLTPEKLDQAVRPFTAWVLEREREGNLPASARQAILRQVAYLVSEKAG